MNDWVSNELVGEWVKEWEIEGVSYSKLYKYLLLIVYQDITVCLHSVCIIVLIDTTLYREYLQ